MNKKYFFVIALIFFAATFYSCLIPPYDVAEYFPLNDGDEWTYSYKLDVTGGPNDGLQITAQLTMLVDGTEVVSEVETTKLNLMFPGPGNPDYYCYNIDSEGLKRYKTYFARFGTYAIFEPPSVDIPARFNVGGVYEGPYSYKSYSIEDDSIIATFTGNQTIKFVSAESKSVQAGSFQDCLELSHSGFTQASDRTLTFTQTMWYARNVGMIKQELIEDYNVGGEDIKATITSELISATVDGITYE